MQQYRAYLYTGEERKRRQYFFCKHFQVDTHRQSYGKYQYKVLTYLVRPLNVAYRLYEAERYSQYGDGYHNKQASVHIAVDEYFQPRAYGKAAYCKSNYSYQLADRFLSRGIDL